MGSGCCGRSARSPTPASPTRCRRTQPARRAHGVLAVVYLIFNEGYGRSDGRLTAEAIRLTRLLVDLMPDEDESPRPARPHVPPGGPALDPVRRPRGPGADGGAGPQPLGSRRSRRAAGSSRRAGASGRPLGAYRLQAEIAACHATAPVAGSTPGQDRAPVRRPAPRPAVPSVTALNRAIAVGFRDGLRRWPSGSWRCSTAWRHTPAARGAGDLLRRLGRHQEAGRALRGARLTQEARPNVDCWSAAWPKSAGDMSSAVRRPVTTYRGS